MCSPNDFFFRGCCFAERELLQRNIKKHISEPVELQLNKGTKDMWDEILIAFRNILTKAENAYLVKAKSKCGILVSFS